MPRQRILLQLAQHGPAEHVRQEYVERDSGRLELLRKLERLDAAHRDENLETAIPREVHHDPRIMRIVFNDQQDAVANNDLQPIIRDLLDRTLDGRNKTLVL